MLKRLYVNNFKALVHFDINLDKLTVIAGDNASGKSTIIQAAAFLKACCTRGIAAYLTERNVTIDDLVSHLPQRLNRIMEFQCQFEFDGEMLEWDITFLTERTTNAISLRTEKVVLIRGNKDAGFEKKELLLYDAQTSQIYNEETQKWEENGKGHFEASRLSNLERKSAALRYPHLLKIVEYFENSEPLDLLAPSEMRRSARGNTRTLGRSGERLPALLNTLSDREKKELLQEVRSTLPQLKSIDSVVTMRGQGWTHLETIENYQDHDISIGASDISDGTLRLIALFAIKYTDNSSGITLLDEIEDGINSANLSTVYQYIQKIADEGRHQFLITTHSTVLLDYVDPDKIRWIYRNERGEVRSARFDSSEEIRKRLSFLYPGELILNTEKGELTSLLKGGEQQDD